MDQALIEVIDSWFQNRQVVDDDNFGLYFRRVLNRDYGRYQQLLRIEPEISEYDWLVEYYKEAQTSNNVNSSVTGDNSSTVTHGLKIDVKNSGSHTGDVKHDFSQNADENYDDSTNNSKTSGKSNNTRTDNLSQENNSSNTRTDNLSQKNTSKQETLLKQGSRDNTVNLGKSNPQSISYSDSQVGDADNVVAGVPGLDWRYPSTQSQSVVEHSPVGVDPDVVQSEDNQTNTGTVQNTGSNTVTNTGTVSNESNSSSEGSGSNKVKYNRNTNNTDTYNEQTGGTQTTTNSGDDKTVGNSSSTSNVEENNYRIESGRNGFRDIASILRDAMSFIENSSAWEWLEPRLEVCFMGVYDV